LSSLTQNRFHVWLKFVIFDNRIPSNFSGEKLAASNNVQKVNSR